MWMLLHLCHHNNCFSYFFVVQVYNNFTCNCECDEILNCPPMFSFDTDTCACVCNSSSFSCPAGQKLDTLSCQCVCDSGTCPPGQMFADSTCECVHSSSSSCPRYMHSILYIHMCVIFTIIILCFLYT